MSGNILKIAVCDDVPEDRKTMTALLSEYLDKNNICATIDEYESGEAFLSSDTSSYLLVFLDIFMDGINGMETAKSLISRNDRVQVVFGSTSSDFAAEAFDISALHYLVKPLEREKLFAVLHKFFENYYLVQTVSVKVGRIEEDIYLNDILWAEARGKKTVLHLKQGEIEISNSISALARLLPESDFCKPIRYALVSMREMIAVPSDTVKLSDGTEIPISRAERKNMKNTFADYKWKKMRGRLGGR
ncbi:MAG: LytTR family DNA-binding domain-containing protein [Hespellia sp.]|nr:LytTR family DNA-binding domain-containing protein [Hespellia sp.]